MNNVEKYKNLILNSMVLFILGLITFVFTWKNIMDMPIWQNEKWSRIAIILVTFFFTECVLCMEMKRKSKIYELLYRFLPWLLLVFIYPYLPVKLVYIPLMLPAVGVIMAYGSTISVVFNAFVVIYYYYTEFVDIDILILYFWFFVYIYFLGRRVNVKKAKCLIKLIATFFGYFVLSSAYQYMIYDKINKKKLLIGLIVLIISVIPFYFKDLLRDINNAYLRKSLIKINDDENELLLSLMDKDKKLYFHSLRVADVSVKVAKEMSANMQLVNAGARFHEIGKLMGDDYVSCGIKIMKNNNFPMEVIKIVKEHNSKSNIPRTMESAIVMLTDSIETTINNLIESRGNNFNQKKIVENVIDIRFDSGMLDYAVTDISQLKRLRKVYTDIYDTNMK